jgi:hypothetical protein
MIWPKLLTTVALTAGAWQSWKALGTPIVRGGRKWYRQPDGRYRRWYGGRPVAEEDLPAD